MNPIREAIAKFRSGDIKWAQAALAFRPFDTFHDTNRIAWPVPTEDGFASGMVSTDPNDPRATRVCAVGGICRIVGVHQMELLDLDTRECLDLAALEAGVEPDGEEPTLGFLMTTLNDGLNPLEYAKSYERILEVMERAAELLDERREWREVA